MGHDSVRAALIYQHATSEADARIAAALNDELAGHAGGGEQSPGAVDRHRDDNDA
jgi:hypothetical protein